MLKRVATFTEPWEAHLFRGRLQAEGLFAVVVFDQHPWMNYSVAWAIGGAQVQVVESELEQAREIERRCRAGEYQSAIGDDAGSSELWVCRSCGSQDYQRRRTSSAFLSLAATLVFGIPLPIRGYIDRCRQCGNEWAE